MDVLGVTPHPFRMTASVPDEMVSLEADGEWAAWSGVAIWSRGTRAGGTEAGGTRKGGTRAGGTEAGGPGEGAPGEGGAPDSGPESVALVSIAVTPLRLASAAAAGETLRAALRQRHPAGTAVIDEIATAGGNPALRVKETVDQLVNGHPVTTGQVQVLVVFSGAGALGVVSGICPDPADLDRAVALVSEIAARLSVTAGQAAA
jgi:hypothetical protein